MTTTIEEAPDRSFTTSPQIRARAQKALDYLSEHPESHNQKYWFVNLGQSTYDRKVDWTGIKVKFDDDGEPNVCGTQMCLAGTVQFQEYGVKGLRKFSRDEGAAWREAGKLLGLGHTVARSVFHQTGSNEVAIQMLENLAKGVHPYTDVTNWHSAIPR